MPCPLQRDHQAQGTSPIQLCCPSSSCWGLSSLPSSCASSETVASWGARYSFSLDPCPFEAQLLRVFCLPPPGQSIAPPHNKTIVPPSCGLYTGESPRRDILGYSWRSLAPERVAGGGCLLTLILRVYLAGSTHHRRFWHSHLHLGDGPGGLLHHRHLHAGECAPPAWPLQIPTSPRFWRAGLQPSPPGRVIRSWATPEGCCDDVQSRGYPGYPNCV